MDSSDAHIVGLVADILDRSRIQGIARAVGAGIAFASSPSELDALISSETRTIFFDLSDAKVEAVEAIRQISSSRDEGSARPLLIGFVAHVDKASSAAAREAGCDEVLARSSFFRRLSLVLAEASSED